MNGMDATVRGRLGAAGIRTAALCGAFLLAACAPNAWKNVPAENTFLGRVQSACYYQRIGSVEIGDLLTSPGSNQGDYFIDMTSRLEAGQITAAAWTDGVTSFLDGRATDPGVKCVLDQLPQR